MKRAELYLFEKGLMETKFEHPRLTYAVQKNMRLVRQAIEDMEATVKPSEDYKKYLEERESLAKQYAKKEKDGSPKTRKERDPVGVERDVYDTPGSGEKGAKEYEDGLKALVEKHRPAINEHAEKIKKYNEEFLMDETDFKPYQIDIDVLVNSKEGCSQEEMNRIGFMFKDAEES